MSEVEVDAATIAAVRAQSAVAHELPEPEMPLHPMLDPKLADPMWSMRDPSNEDIVVSVLPGERDQYWRAMLHNEPMKWTVDLMAHQLSVDVSVPPIWLQQTIERHFEAQEQALSATASRARLLNNYMVVVCLTRVKEVRHADSVLLTVPDFSFQKKNGEANKQAIVELLEFYEEINPALFSALLTACRIADMKWTLCVRKQASQNFWRPVGTA